MVQKLWPNIKYCTHTCTRKHTFFLHIFKSQFFKLNIEISFLLLLFLMITRRFLMNDKSCKEFWAWWVLGELFKKVISAFHYQPFWFIINETFTIWSSTVYYSFCNITKKYTILSFLKVFLISLFTIWKCSISVLYFQWLFGIQITIWFIIEINQPINNLLFH